MKKVIYTSILLSCAVLFPLTGCQTVQDSVKVFGVGGDQKFDMQYVKANLKKGVTTSEDVIKLFGKPDYQTAGAAGPTYFSYREGKKSANKLLHSAASSLGYGNAADTARSVSEGKGRQLSIYFQNNKVESFSVSE